MTLIELAFVELFEHDVIDWLPGDGEPETFQAECMIENYGMLEPLYSVTLCNWEIFIWWRMGKLEAYFAVEQSREVLTR